MAAATRVEIDAADCLAQTAHTELLRFTTAGSVDDGKSTLIGRLLYDCALIFDDHLAALERESRRFGTAGDDIDFSLVLSRLPLGFVPAPGVLLGGILASVTDC